MASRFSTLYHMPRPSQLTFFQTIILVGCLISILFSLISILLVALIFECWPQKCKITFVLFLNQL